MSCTRHIACHSDTNLSHQSTVNYTNAHRRSRGGEGGRRDKYSPKIAPPPKKKYKKMVANFFIFCPEPCLGGLQGPFRSQECPRPHEECPPPSRGVPPQDKFLATPMLVLTPKLTSVNGEKMHKITHTKTKPKTNWS